MPHNLSSKILSTLSIFVATIELQKTDCHAFSSLRPSPIVLPQLTSTTIPPTHHHSHSSIYSILHGQISNDDGELEDDELSQMKEDIEQMKREAAQRIAALSNQIGSSSSTSRSTSISTTTNTSAPKEESLNSENEEESKSQVAVSNAVQTLPTKTKSTQKEDLDILEGTQWKMVLNIGREPGTWMPKTWGVSGERLRANLEIQFTSKQLYDREEFLGGIGGSKECHVIHNSITLGPSITEGQRNIPLTPGPGAGGWRIAKGTGPLGTDMLRFYIDLQEEMSHSGSDVYCPKGRIYMQCGLFELKNPNNVEFGGRKEELKRQFQEVTDKYKDLNDKIEQEGFISLEKVKLTREMFQVSMDARMINAKLNDARVLEPDKSILTISKDGDIGLTREGGVVCKVMKGAVMEYHILGRFALVAMDLTKEDEQEREKVH